MGEKAERDVRFFEGASRFYVPVPPCRSGHGESVQLKLLHLFIGCEKRAAEPCLKY